MLEHATDDDPNALRGMAITAVDTAKGRWEYSTNGGQSWTIISGVSPTAALLLADKPDTRIRFIPARPLVPGLRELLVQGVGPVERVGQGDAGRHDGIDESVQHGHRAGLGGRRQDQAEGGRGRSSAARTGARGLKVSAAYMVKSFLGLLRLERERPVLSGIAVSGADETGGKWQYNVGTGGRTSGT